MPSIKLDHYNVWTTRLTESVNFYTELLGLTVGDRPSFGIPGAWLYDSTNKPVVHLIDVENSTPAQRAEAGDLDIAKLGGSGSIDHIAFETSDFSTFRSRLRDAGINYREARFPSLKLVQLFVKDPNGVGVELLFRGVG